MGVRVADEINLDATAAVAFVAEGSSVRHQMKATVLGRVMVMTATARQEFARILKGSAGPREQARAHRLLTRVTVIPDNPSARALGLTPTGNLEASDIAIFGTADAMGIETFTADRRAVSAARYQGVSFTVIFHQPASLTGT
jgi:hypothetical protein